MILHGSWLRWCRHAVAPVPAAVRIAGWPQCVRSDDNPAARHVAHPDPYWACPVILQKAGGWPGGATALSEGMIRVPNNPTAAQRAAGRDRAMQRRHGWHLHCGDDAVSGCVTGLARLADGIGAAEFARHLLAPPYRTSRCPAPPTTGPRLSVWGWAGATDLTLRPVVPTWRICWPPATVGGVPSARNRRSPWHFPVSGQAWPRSGTTPRVPPAISSAASASGTMGGRDEGTAR